VSTEEALANSRKIIHIDMDCFFAAVEVRENPSLQGKPVAVGGKPNSRGVVAACNYEARKFGIHSGMPMSLAVRKCPDLVITPVNMVLYKSISAAIQDIFQQYTDLIEPLSLDEAYLDVTNVDLFSGSATLIARDIRQKIVATQGLTASAGVAPNKFLAKVASDWNKPNGQKVIAPEEVTDFVSQLPVTAISGVGKVTAKKMQNLGILTCGDLNRLGLTRLCQYFGGFGEQLYHYSLGIDHRPVINHRIRKSLSVETTFAQDLGNLDACLQSLPEIYEELLQRLKRAEKLQRLLPRSVFVKLRFHDFATTTIQKPASKPDERDYKQLLKTAWQRGKRPVRLIGIGIQFLPPDKPEQLTLFK